MMTKHHCFTSMYMQSKFLENLQRASDKVGKMKTDDGSLTYLGKILVFPQMENKKLKNHL